MKDARDLINILILDIETTGLDEKYDSILEIAFIPAQLSSNGLNIKPDQAFSSIIKPYKPGFKNMQARVIEMHTQNGLLAEIAALSGPEGGIYWDINKVEADILCKIDEIFGAEAKHIYLCGNSIQFDRAFIKNDMKKLEARLSYRMLDMTTFRTIYDAVNSMFKVVEKNSSNHRALADCEYSVGLLEQFHTMIYSGLNRRYNGV